MKGNIIKSGGDKYCGAIINIKGLNKINFNMRNIIGITWFNYYNKQQDNGTVEIMIRILDRYK